MAWELGAKPNLAMVIPVDREVSASWARSLKELIVPERHYSFHASRGIPQLDKVRNHLLKLALADFAGIPHDWLKRTPTKDLMKMALADGLPKYVFMLDCDVIPPRDALLRLMAWRLPFVAGLYHLKKGGWNLYRLEGRKAVELSKDDVRRFEEGGLRPMQVDAAGLGLCLLDVRVLKRLPEPWFEWTLDLDSEELGYSEDINFCLKLREAGFPVYADISVKAKHVLGSGTCLDEEGEVKACL